MIREEGFYQHLRACAGIGGIWLLAFPLVLSLITTEKEERTQQPRPSNFAVIQIPTENTRQGCGSDEDSSLILLRPC
ncbi:hypothetical protein VNO80_18036 [Phaseolus coccineus]|uniref:Uncharacterized protein n=1 Tax=Phaseolus coccineus TaxID=3886 RepID=A0AAN9MIL0_PHACN